MSMVRWTQPCPTCGLSPVIGKIGQTASARGCPDSWHEDGLTDDQAGDQVMAMLEEDADRVADPGLTREEAEALLSAAEAAFGENLTDEDVSARAKLRAVLGDREANK